MDAAAFHGTPANTTRGLSPLGCPFLGFAFWGVAFWGLVLSWTGQSLSAAPCPQSVDDVDDPNPLGGIRFVDGTERAGLARSGTSYDAAFADMDRDGDLDLLVSNHGGQVSFYRNDGNGRFEDVAQDVGFDREDDFHGFAVADLDRNGEWDIYWTVGDKRGTQPTRNRLFLQNDGFFAEPEESLVWEDPRGRGRGALFCDVSGNGLVDCVVTNMASPAAFCINDGKGLKDFVPQKRLPEIEGFMVVTEDLDEDGRLDYVFSGSGRATCLLSTKGVIPLEDAGNWRGVAAVDLDRDGHIDLIATQRNLLKDSVHCADGEFRGRLRVPGKRDKRLSLTLKNDELEWMVEWGGLWWGPGGEQSKTPQTFEVLTSTLDKEPRSAPPGSVVCWMSDDSTLEILFRARPGTGAMFLRIAGGVENFAGPELLLSGESPPLDVRLGRGDGTFEKVSLEGLDRGLDGIRPLAEDFDHDGDLDLFVMTEGDRVARSRAFFFENLGERRFADRTDKVGLSELSASVTFGGCVGDVDGDGDLDVFLANGHLPPGWPGGTRQLLINELRSADEAPKGCHWITILPSRDDAKTPLGAKVTIRCGDEQWSRRFGLEGGPLSRGVPPVLFGVGSHKVIDEILIEYLDGETQVMKNLDVDRSYGTR